MVTSTILTFTNGKMII